MTDKRSSSHRISTAFLFQNGHWAFTLLSTYAWLLPCCCLDQLILAQPSLATPTRLMEKLVMLGSLYFTLSSFIHPVCLWAFTGFKHSQLVIMLFKNGPSFWQIRSMKTITCYVTCNITSNHGKSIFKQSHHNLFIFNPPPVIDLPLKN